MNPGQVVAEMVDASSYPNLSAQYGIYSVPETIVSGQSEERVVGAVPEAQLLKLIRIALS